MTRDKGTKDKCPLLTSSPFAARGNSHYNRRAMRESRMVATQLQRRDPAAWSALLREQLGVEELVVTAVSSKPVLFPTGNGRVTRYLLALENHADPISFIGKRTTPTEIQFYQHLAHQLPDLVPSCRFIHPPDATEIGWLILEDVPNHLPPHKWAVEDAERVIGRLADLHATFWEQETAVQQAGLHSCLDGEPYSWDELWEGQSGHFEGVPAMMLSDHARHQAGRLAPALIRAANGLAIMRDLGGWPGILDEAHLTAAADLLDDPVPMLEPLRQLPTTLLHGAPHSYHWRLTLFDEVYLLDWQKATIGPGICDLVNFLEQFELLFLDADRCQMQPRPFWPLSEETMVDSYMIAMKQRLNGQFAGRAARQALPAARCLYVLTHWFAHFGDWFTELPNPQNWLHISTQADEQLMGTKHEPIVQVRPYLQGLFGRFLQAYHSL